MSRSWIGASLAVLPLCGLIATAVSAHPGTLTNDENNREHSFLGSRAGDAREVGGIKLCWCPPGSFRMGSPPGEPERRPDEAQVDVTLTKGFWMGKYAVTQGEWKRVAGKLPGELTTRGGEG